MPALLCPRCQRPYEDDWCYHCKMFTCADCNGSGADPAKTAAARRTGACDSGSYIRCWTCNGNGLNPAAFFRCGAHT
jgi:hypothetical protein